MREVHSAFADEVQSTPSNALDCCVAVIWIDWYAYHVARFCGLNAAASLKGRVTGLELVGGIGVHAGLKFREDLPDELPIETLLPESSWREANKFKLARKLWRRLSVLNPEVVLVPGYYTLPAIAAALWARVHRRASVLMTESTASDHSRVWWREKLKSLLLSGLFDWAVSGGRAHVEYLKQLKFPADRIASFYDVVDNDMFNEGTRELRRSSSSLFDLPRRYFLYVGRLAEEKNVEQLLASWLKYRAAGGTWSLVLVGDGPGASFLKQIAAASQFASEVYFPGLKSSRELLPFYAFAGSFVLPSTREPWGLVVNEAMASGLPVLVSNRCGCAADLVLHNVNGFVFDPGREDQLTSYLHLFESLSAAELGAMGRRSAEIIQSFSPNRFGLEIAKIADSRTPRTTLKSLTGGSR